MKKFLLAASMLFMGVVATFAQNDLDASSWTVGDEITSELSWGNLDFTANPMTDWTLGPGSGTTTGGAFEAYNNAEVDLYQYVWLPAGMYKMTCQGYYRGGSSGSDDPEAELGTGQCAYNWLNKADLWEDNAFITATTGTLSADKKSFTPDHAFKSALMPRLYEARATQIFDEGANHPDGWNKSDYYYTDLECWGPTSFPGSCAWFEQGMYQPKDGVKYNSVTFFLTEPGYVKVGITKNKKIDQDTFFATDFKMYYMGEPDEIAAVMLAQSDLQELYDEIQGIIEEHDGDFIAVQGNEILVGEIQDIYGYYPEDINDPTLLANAKKESQQLMANMKKAITDMANLQNAVDVAFTLATSVGDDPDKEDAVKKLLDVIDAAESYLDDSYDYNEEDGWDAIEKQIDALNAARLALLTSSEPNEDGAWDFTSFISYPWFCNTGLEPTWDAENNKWVPNETIMATDWATKDDIAGTDVGYYMNNGQQVFVSDYHPAEQVKISSDENSVGQWYQINNGLVTYWNDYLTCVKKWDTPHTDDGVREIAQNIVGVPNGFYQLKALGQTWSNDWDNDEKLCKCRIYIQSGDNISESPYLEKGGWWSPNIDHWKELKTDMIEVKDGTLKIAAHDNGFIAWTGFRLFYYGEAPDFDEMLFDSYMQAYADASNLWNGDQAIVIAMLDDIPQPIATKEEYLAGVQTIAEANAYMNDAKVVNTWKGKDNFNALYLAQAEGSDEAALVKFAADKVNEMGNSEYGEWFYTAIPEADAKYNAYAAYMAFRESISKFVATDADLAAVVAGQNAYLKENLATPEKLDEFKEALAVPYNIAKFREGGAETATLDNPVDVTFLIINPDFLEGINKGWTVEKKDGTYCNDQFSWEFVEGKPTRTIAEIWGAAQDFSITQTLNGLPAGTYELRAHAMYRDDWGVNDSGLNNYIQDGAENWRHNEATLFAEGKNGQYRQTTPVSSIYSLRATEPIFTYYSSDTWYVFDDYYAIWEPTKISFLAKYEDSLPEGTTDEMKEGKDDENRDLKKDYGVIPFDTPITIQDVPDGADEPEDVTYYFPQRTIGVVKAVENDYNNYLNKLYINLPEGGSMTIGIVKGASGGGCSITMDDFELFYCGTAIPTAIDAITEAGEGAEDAEVEYYSIDGVKLSAPQKGINIIKKGAETKKVFIQ